MSSNQQDNGIEIVNISFNNADNGWRTRKRIRRHAKQKEQKAYGKVKKVAVENKETKKTDLIYVQSYTKSQTSHYKRSIRNRAKKMGLGTSEYKRLFIQKDVPLEMEDEPVTKKWCEEPGDEFGPRYVW
jgi:hypothetical protein